MKTVLIAGGSGLIGNRLSQLLSERGYAVRWLSRNPGGGAPYPAFAWNPDRGDLDSRALEGVDAVINLAGAGIADGRWTEQRKALIISSRVNSTRLLAQKMGEMDRPPKVYLSGAAIGIYGDRGDESLDETAQPGNSGFLAESCRQWEAAIQALATALPIRTCYFRIGLVLSGKGGALPKIKLPFYLGQGAYFGHGRQWYSWIHIDDVCGMFMEALEQEHWSGVYNATAPEPETNRLLTRMVGRVWFGYGLNIPIPVPAFALKFILGEMAETVLSSARVYPKRALEAGYKFGFPTLEAGLRDLKARKL